MTRSIFFPGNAGQLLDGIAIERCGERCAVGRMPGDGRSRLSSLAVLLGVLIGLATLSTDMALAGGEVPVAQLVIDGAFDGASSIHATDIDGDGDVDVLGAAREADDVTWWENTAGDGSAWTEHTIDGAFDGATSVYAADVDGDGDADVLGAAQFGDAVSWWENTAGDGTAWTEHTVDGTFDGAFSVYAADVDGDGDTDVLGAASEDHDITWWENTAGDGTAWMEHKVDGVFDGARSVSATDLDGDGDVDVLGAAFGADDITWWENTAGDGTAWTEHTVDGAFDGAHSVYAADVDGDGDIDVLGAALFAAEITWWENTAGDGSAWAEHVVDGTFVGAFSVYATDVDGDGDVDVLGAASSADDITWWENVGGDGVTWSEHTVDGSFDGALSVFAADVDGDGDTDVLGAAFDADDIAWWENETIHQSAVHPQEHTVDGAFIAVLSVHAADVDGDGDIDVLGASQGADDINWWENSAGDGTAWSEHTVDGSFDAAASVYAADVDGDGDTDVLGAAFNADAITWWENTDGGGTVWAEHTIDGSFGGAESVFATDVDGDGDIDVLGAGLFASDIAWWENTVGDGTVWIEHTVDSDFQQATSVYAADMDGDGDTDVLGAAQLADDITWWENTGLCTGGMTGTDCDAWIEHTVEGAFDRPFSVFAADVDGDGDMDVLGAALNADDITWWENTGPCTGGVSGGDCDAWTEHTVDGSFNGAVTVYATDVDGDGDTDVLGAAQNADDITWWENTGPCTGGMSGTDCEAWIEHTVDDAFNGARSVYAADLNGDGATDVLGGAILSNEIAWWKNRGGQFALPTVNLAPTQLPQGATEAVLEIDAIHRGRAGDSDAELVTLELVLAESLKAALTDTQADDLFVALSIFLDDGSGVFEAGVDTEVTFVTSFPLIGGVLTVPFADDDPDAQFAVGSPKKYFVVVELEADAAQQTPNQVIVRHFTEGSSTGEDAAHDLPIRLEFSANVATGTIIIVDPQPIFSDGFESGDTGAWS